MTDDILRIGFGCRSIINDATIGQGSWIGSRDKVVHIMKNIICSEPS